MQANAPVQLFVYPALRRQEKEFLLQRLPRGIAPVFNDELAEEERAEHFAASHFLYGNAPPSWLERPGLQLRWVQLNSAGFDPYQRLGLQIPVSNMHGFFAQPCAETVVAGILALYRKIHTLSLLQSRKEWLGAALRPQLRLLKGKEVILLGAGTIALAIREILQGFGCRILLFARTNPQAGLRTPSELLGALPAADLLINTLPGIAETEKFVSLQILQAVKPGAVFANIGRGSTVDEKALIEVLESGHLGGAVLDVTETEPLPPSSPLWTCPNMLLTQHTGGGSAEEEQGKLLVLLRNLELVMKGEAPLFLIDLRRGY